VTSGHAAIRKVIMKILIIGSEGFIGRFMIRDLKAKGHEIVGFDLCPGDAGKSGYTFVQGNLLNAGDLRSAMQGADLVMNLAAKHHDFGISREDFFQINEAGTQVILDVLTECRIKKFIFFSSVAVYGLHDTATSEDTPLTPCNDYGKSKLAGETLIRQWAQADPSREVLVVRPVVVYGPHNYANMFRLIDNIYRRRFLMVGKGENIKSTAYVENLVEAAVFMMERMRPGYDIVNYSDYPQKRSLEIANIICGELGRPPLRFRFPLPLAVCLACPFDLLAKLTGKNIPITANRIQKFARMNTWHGSDKVRSLGYQQRFSTEEGLKRMVAWYLAEGRRYRERCSSGERI